MKTKKLVFLSLMVAYSLALYLLETIIPNPLIAFFPGAKLGLSNIITLISLLSFGFRDSFVILTIRIILSSIFAGPATTLLYSISGGYLSLIFMYLFSKFKFDTITVSIIGAIFHNIGQLLMASLIIYNISFMTYLPFMIGASVVTGIFIGIVVKFAMKTRFIQKMERYKNEY